MRPILIIIVVVAGAWWLLSDGDDEAQVREAHEDLASLLSKTEDEAGAATVLNARSLQGLLAISVAVTGDAGALAGNYTPDQAASTAAGVKSLFRAVNLSFGELTISFPNDNEATTEFAATLIGIPITEGQRAIEETRSVVSTMRRLDGDWLFAGFSLTEQGITTRSNE